MEPKQLLKTAHLYINSLYDGHNESPEDINRWFFKNYPKDLDDLMKFYQDVCSSRIFDITEDHELYSMIFSIWKSTLDYVVNQYTELFKFYSERKVAA